MEAERRCRRVSLLSSSCQLRRSNAFRRRRAHLSESELVEKSVNSLLNQAIHYGGCSASTAMGAAVSSAGVSSTGQLPPAVIVVEHCLLKKNVTPFCGHCRVLTGERDDYSGLGAASSEDGNCMELVVLIVDKNKKGTMV